MDESYRKDMEEKARAEGERREAERERKLREKFRLSAGDKSAIRQAFMAMVDKQLDTLEESYVAAFRGLPNDVLDGMTDNDAAKLMEMVVKEAASGIEAGSRRLQAEVANVSKDEAKMDAIRKGFMESLGMGGNAGEEENDG